jgi:hypothetical protein
VTGVSPVTTDRAAAIIDSLHLERESPVLRPNVSCESSAETLTFQSGRKFIKNLIGEGRL